MAVTVVEVSAPDKTVEVVILRVIAYVTDPLAVAAPPATSALGSAMNNGMN